MAALRFNLILLIAVPQASATFSLSSSQRIAVISPDAGASSSLKEHEAGSLLQADVAQKQRSKVSEPHPPAWFGDFSEGESTYDYDGTLGQRGVFPSTMVMDGWNPTQENPFFDRAVDRKWFQESKSGGEKQAWQSFWPSEEASMSGNRATTGKWFEGDGGRFQQEYRPTTVLRAENVPAGWFDDSVNQLDGFGRQKLPAIDGPRNYLEWEERSVNTSLSCQAPGCTANVSLLAPFDFNKEMYKNCRLSVFFHPTDFDDQNSGESVEWVQVNGQKVKSLCKPLASGCNQTAWRPLLPCVDDIHIDLLMPANGDLKVAAKIPDYVDECPYKGNMLSAVPMVTCMVAPKHVEGAPIPKSVLQTSDECITKMPLRCKTKGCASEIAIPVNSTCAGLGQCLLSIEVMQTDYDNGDGTSELIEYIKVDGKDAATKVNPGKNPCKTKYMGGAALTEEEMKFKALDAHKLNITNGKVVVEGKISKFVDECASKGHLFDAVATVTCSKSGASLLQDGTEPRRRQLKLRSKGQ